jgi:hypothetical protein
MFGSRNHVAVRVACWFIVARVFRRGGLSLTRGKTLASKEASYKFIAMGSKPLAPRKYGTGTMR